MQATYIPHSVKGCLNADKWQVGDSGGESFFHMAGRLNKTMVSAQVMCRNYVATWVMAIAAASLTAVSAFICFTPSAIETYQKSAGMTDFLRLFFLESVPKALMLIPWLLWLVPRFLVHLIPRTMRARILYSIRYLAKFSGRVRAPMAIKMRSLRQERDLGSTGDFPRGDSEVLRSDWVPGGGDGASLARLLVYDILVLIAQDLHFGDLTNLSLASKNVRQAIFPAPEFAARSECLRRYSCAGEKGRCWACDIQICQ
ncbi:MAG: hypothetical protein M1839_004637, partial [Geoglossum umbratile]